MKDKSVCPLSAYCGSCDFVGSYEDELKEKTRIACRNLKGFGPVATIIGSEVTRYRDKVQAVVGYDRKYLLSCLKNCEVNYSTATYYLLEKDLEDNNA